MQSINNLLDTIYKNKTTRIKDIEYVLKLEDADSLAKLYNYADSIRKEYMGDEVLLRGIIDFSNYCSNGCEYCGLNSNNKKLSRYRMNTDEIMESVRTIAGIGIKTVILQSGEERGLDSFWLAELVRKIKAQYEMAVTLSVGEKTKEEYMKWRSAGADRYLLKIETTDKDLYLSLHPGMSFDNRIKCLKILKKLGYQVGCGNIIGLKGQTIKSIAKDICFFKENDFDMIGIGPFIPHPDTPLKESQTGEMMLTLKTIALTRMITRNAHIPATTALGSLGSYDFRIDALKAGANVIMPDFTPLPYKQLYEIYPAKRCLHETGSLCVGCLKNKVESIGRYISFKRGDSVKV